MFDTGAGQSAPFTKRMNSKRPGTSYSAGRAAPAAARLSDPDRPRPTPRAAGTASHAVRANQSDKMLSSDLRPDVKSHEVLPAGGQ